MRVIRLFSVLIAMLLAPITFGASAAAEAEVTVSVTYRDRALLPPGAILTVTLADISRMDTAARVISQVQYTDLGAPPFAFALPYDPSEIDARLTYAVSARATVGERLVMTTDTVTPVLTRGAEEHAELMMVRVTGSAKEDELSQQMAAPGLMLPASFKGEVNSVSGPTTWHLDLWPDQVFHLHQTSGTGGASDIGRWHADPDRGAIVLQGGREAPMVLEVRGNGDLRIVESGANGLSDTLAAGPLDPVEVALPMRGMFRYFADAAVFTECLTGRSYPVSGEGDYLALERAYLDARSEAAEPILAVLEGQIAVRPAMEGPDAPHLVVDRFSRLAPTSTCERAQATATLSNTYWRILELSGEPLGTVEGRREPHLILRESDELAFNATVGCNMMRGGYEIEGASLRFGNAAMTMMACPPPLDAEEHSLGQALAQVRSWKVNGMTLELLDADGGVLLLAEAVYLP